MKSKKPYEIRRANSRKDGNIDRVWIKPQFYWVQIAANGEVQATSEMYTTKSAAKQGVIDSVNRNEQFATSNQASAFAYKDWRFWATDTTLSKSKTIQK